MKRKNKKQKKTNYSIVLNVKNTPRIASFHPGKLKNVELCRVVFLV
jgi:hypothetical protein